MKKDLVYENTAIGNIRIVPTLKFFRDMAKDYCGELSEWEHITIVTNDGTCNGIPGFPVYNTFESGDDMSQVRSVLRKSCILAIIWECFEGETCFYGDPDRIVYETDLYGLSFALSDLVQWEWDDPLMERAWLFSRYEYEN